MEIGEDYYLVCCSEMMPGPLPRDSTASQLRGHPKVCRSVRYGPEAATHLDVSSTPPHKREPARGIAPHRRRRQEGPSPSSRQLSIGVLTTLLILRLLLKKCSGTESDEIVVRMGSRFSFRSRYPRIEQQPRNQSGLYAYVFLRGLEGLGL